MTYPVAYLSVSALTGMSSDEFWAPNTVMLRLDQDFSKMGSSRNSFRKRQRE